MPKEKNKSHRLPVLFYSDQFDKIKESYKQEGHSDMSSYIRWIVNNYINSKQK